MPFHTEVLVLSNIPKAVGPGAKLVQVNLTGKNPASLPFAHKKIFADRVNDFDLFIYSEDDTLITESNIKAYLKACTVLADNEIPGFFRFERGVDGQLNYPEVHGPFHWDCQSVRNRSGWVFASFTNEHSACFVLTQRQLKRAIASGGFLVEPHHGKYDFICTAATDPYTQCGFDKVIGLTPLDDFLVHHLPNVYVGSTFGVGETELSGQIQRLVQIAENGHRPSPLFSSVSKLMSARFSKDCYETPQREIIDSIPAETRTVLSLGCGRAATEAALVERGLKVVAVPVDAVFSSGARAKGVEIVEGDMAAAREKLGGRQFDCILVADILHLMEDPVAVMRTFVPLLRKGGTAIVRVPVIQRFVTIYRSIRGDQRLTELDIYEKTGINFVSSRIVRRWLKRSGLQIDKVGTDVPTGNSRLPRFLKPLLRPIRARQMGAKMIFTATKH